MVQFTGVNMRSVWQMTGKWMKHNIRSNKSCTHRLLSAPVHSCWGTTQTCRWTSLPTSPRPPAGSHWWCRPWRTRVRPHWSARRESVPWPASGHTRCPLTCPGKRGEQGRQSWVAAYMTTDRCLFTSRGQRRNLHCTRAGLQRTNIWVFITDWHQFCTSNRCLCLSTVITRDMCCCHCHGNSPGCGTEAASL